MPGGGLSELEQRLHYCPGANPAILVAAPHHGHQQGCDYYTKEFASLLSAQLGAALLVADGLRPLVDLNKEPRRAATPETPAPLPDLPEIRPGGPGKAFPGSPRPYPRSL